MNIEQLIKALEDENTLRREQLKEIRREIALIQGGICMLVGMFVFICLQVL